MPTAVHLQPQRKRRGRSRNERGLRRDQLRFDVRRAHGRGTDRRAQGKSRDREDPNYLAHKSAHEW
jgi:hypothetical protein